MMEQRQHIAAEEVRASSTPHIVRYVLGISLTLAIIVMIVILWSN